MKNEKLIDQYRHIHATESWGNTSLSLHGAYIKTIFSEKKPKKILDYGCGQSTLSEMLRSEVSSIDTAYRYDPSIPEIQELPDERVDWVINTDVLEHIPEEDLDSFLLAIKEVSSRAIFMIHMFEAALVLPNGQNAHCTIHDSKWWSEKINGHFPVITCLGHHSGKHCCIITDTIKPITKIKHLMNRAILFSKRCCLYLFRKLSARKS